MKTASNVSQWLNARQTRTIYGMSIAKLYRLVIAKKIEVKLEPGSMPRYNRADVEQYARVPAKN